MAACGDTGLNNDLTTPVTDPGVEDISDYYTYYGTQVWVKATIQRTSIPRNEGLIMEDHEIVGAVKASQPSPDDKPVYQITGRLTQLAVIRRHAQLSTDATTLLRSLEIRLGRTYNAMLAGDSRISKFLITATDDFVRPWLRR